MQNKQDRQKLWNAQVGGAEQSIQCPGCLTKLIHFDRYKGWEASHIHAGSLGGNTELYNMFALCNVCNGQMKNQNMFCYFMEMGNLVALRALISYVCRIIRLHYPKLWTQCKGQMYHIAKLLYVEKRKEGEGGIPKEHPVLEFFIKEDIEKNKQECRKTAKEYRKKRKIADDTEDLYRRIFLEENTKKAKLPIIMKKETRKKKKEKKDLFF